MKGFDYTLENVLKLRIQTEVERLSEFSSAQRNYNEHMESVVKIESEIDGIIDSFQKAKPTQVASRKHYYFYLENLRFKKGQQNDLLHEAGKFCERKRQAFEKAQIKRKTIESHREKQLDVYKLGEKKKEECILDEMAVIAFKRRLEL
ncbi:MAG: flagellar export protein FliJ [Peptostreptococcaceae bacterium]|nr:flagellar export protein FliJ [Peptostreptococcaceae bacterium]